MSSSWQSPFHALPSDSQEVWVRRWPWFDKPFKCVYDAGEPYFYESLLTGRGIYPEFIHSWKDYP